MARWMAAAVLAAAVSAAAGETADLYVAPGGNDAASGTAQAPLASLAGAKAAVRKLRARQPERKTPVVVLFADGFYPLAETVVFGPEDSGTKESPTVYRGAGKGAVISGGRVLTGWKTDEQGRWTLAVPEMQVTKDDPSCQEAWDAFVARKKLALPGEGKWEISQLWVNDARRYRPRYPDTGYAVMGDAGAPDEYGAKFFGDGKSRGEGSNCVSGGGADPGYRNLKDVEFVLMRSWSTARRRVSKAEKGQFWITGAGTGTRYWNRLTKGRRYVLENIFERMKPGQFYLDRKAGVVTYHPLPGEAPDKAVVVAPRLARLMEFRGDLKGRPAAYVEFHGLTFAHSNWNLIRGNPEGGRNSPHQAELDVDGAIKAVGARGLAFVGCRLTHMGQYALRLDVGCKGCRVEDCEITDVAGGGLWLGSTHEASLRWEDALPEGVTMSDEVATSDCLVRNNLIARCGLMHPGAPAVWMGQIHHAIVEHNDIFDTYYSGISNGWCWGFGRTFNHDNEIRFNVIRRVGGAVADLGGVYTLGESRGTRVANNVIWGVTANRNFQGCGIYTDQGSAYYTFENNLIRQVTDGAYHHHQSKENLVRNNIMVDNAVSTIKISPTGRELAFTLERNVIVWSGGKLIDGGGPVAFKGNCWWNPRGRGDKPKPDAAGLYADPKFVDAAKGDYRLQPDSPAIRNLGFRPFDPGEAGRLKGFTRWSDLPDQPRVW